MPDELMEIVVKNPAFAEGEPIPAKYTADGENVSPPLTWSGVPHRARSLALLCDDPDAPRGTFTHWVVFNLPAQARQLEEGVPAREALPAGGAQGTNDFGRLGYGGPAGPPGRPRRYYFKVSALDAELPLAPGARRQEVVAAMEGHVVAEGWLMGTYRRAGGRAAFAYLFQYPFSTRLASLIDPLLVLHEQHADRPDPDPAPWEGRVLDEDEHV